MRVIGQSVPSLPTAAPSAAALREAAIHQRTGAALSAVATTGVRQGVYRFASHAEMNRYDDEALALAVAMNIQRRAAST